MEEDIAGIRRIAGRVDYATCEECGRIFERRSGAVEEAGLTDESHSEFTELCPDCARLDRQGERAVTPSP